MVSEKAYIREKFNEKHNIKVCKDGPFNVLGTIPLLELTVTNDADD